jgi:hypothetical protein
MYMPDVKDATRVKQIEFENHGGVLFKDIEAEGGIEYLYLLLVFKKDAEEVAVIISAEKSAFSDEIFLCAFTPEGHVNYGPTPGIDNIDEFEKKAIELVESNLNEKLLQ